MFSSFDSTVLSTKDFNYKDNQPAGVEATYLAKIEKNFDSILSGTCFLQARFLVFSVYRPFISFCRLSSRSSKLEGSAFLQVAATPLLVTKFFEEIFCYFS